MIFDLGLPLAMELDQFNGSFFALMVIVFAISLPFFSFDWDIEWRHRIVLSEAWTPRFTNIPATGERPPF